MRRPLDDSYRLVVDGTAITGIVTWSDLLKLPVTVLAFSLVAQLELTMNARIKETYGDDHDSWLELLKKDDRAKILGRLRRLQRQNLALSLLELADFTHKAKVLRPLLSVTRNFEKDLKVVKSLRDEVAHVKDIMRSDAGLKTFVERIETAEVWLEMLKGEKAAAPAAAG